MVIWGVGLGADLSWKARLCVLEPFCPLPGERGVRLSDVSVRVTVVSCSRLPTSYRTGGLHTGK